MGRYAVGLLTLLLASPLPAQGLRAQLSRLFTFGESTTPLRVNGAADLENPGGGVVLINEYLPDAVPANGTIVEFVDHWVSAYLGNVPIGSTSGGPIFRFRRGIPQKDYLSPGPVFGERAQTSGRGRVTVGINRSALDFTTIRGALFRNVRFNFMRRNEDSEACDIREGRDCAPYGVPVVENDIIALQTSVDLDITVTSLYLTYGVSNRIDVGVLVPIVQAELNGSSFAEVIAFSAVRYGRPATFIAGTPTSPEMTSAQAARGSASGVGDIATRLKVNLIRRERTGFSVLGDLRLPTGNEDELLGAGEWSGRALGILSARFGAFSPHANIGYLYWSGDAGNDAFLATVGFDQLVAPWATLAASLISEFQIGESVFTLPEPVTITQPVQRLVRPAELPDVRDNSVTASFGAKFMSRSRLVGVVNALVPVVREGPRPDFAWTVGLEYSF
jgi:hypothetical protein